MVGRIIGPKTFDPKHAIILKDKDDLKIPLDFETIPSAKEFKESISSISEEQQRFAKAFRSMQLESTLFGVCVVQIKPQLERLLGLPEDGLTKEIRLTSDLLELMMKYQIPSDLLSFDGAATASPRERVAVVKNYVAAMCGDFVFCCYYFFFMSFLVQVCHDQQVQDCNFGGSCAGSSVRWQDVVQRKQWI